MKLSDNYLMVITWPISVIVMFCLGCFVFIMVTWMRIGGYLFDKLDSLFSKIFKE